MARPFDIGTGMAQGLVLGFELPNLKGAQGVPETRAVCLDHRQVEILSPPERGPTVAEILPLLGAAPITITGTEPFAGGALISTTGFTHGGKYRVVLLSGETVDFHALVEDPACKALPLQDGKHLLVQFDHPLSPGEALTDPASYEILTDYPVKPLVKRVAFPHEGDPHKVLLEVQGLTATSYTLRVSPSEAIPFRGSELPGGSTEIGSGRSVGIAGKGLSLRKQREAKDYGWFLPDESGRLVPDSNWRAFAEFEMLSGPVELRISDGQVEASLALGPDLVISSGDYRGSFPLDLGPVSLSVVRNSRAGTYTVVANGLHVATVELGAWNGVPTLPRAGAQVTVLGTAEVLWKRLEITSSKTIFTELWNFLHGTPAIFIAPGVLARPSLLTQNGPLVKGWGDATPATKNDVEVRVNGTPVAIAEVNPYYGEIFLEVPIPLVPPGTITVEVDYIWFPVPNFPMITNTLGSVLNKFDQEPGPADVVWSPLPLMDGGGPILPLYRFAMGVVLSPVELRDPLCISYRFVGFEKAYTAALNSPTTLLLNMDPHKVSVLDKQKATEGEIVYYEGTTLPQNSDPPWELLGTNTNTEAFTEVFPVVPPAPGSFAIGQVALYQRRYDASFPSSILMVARVLGREISNFGVFSGMGFGIHTDHHLYAVGFLKSALGVYHVGMLIQPSRSWEIESWQIAFAFDLKIVSQTRVKTTIDQIPALIEDRVLSGRVVRFSILSGTQAGVYTVLGVVYGQEDTVFLDVDPAFPEDPQLWDNAYFTGHFEVRWDGEGQDRPITYRLSATNNRKTQPKGQATLFIGAGLSGNAALITEGVPTLAIPPDITLTLTTGDRGSVFWGSMTPQAQSRSLWNFVRYGVNPAQTTLNFPGIVAAAEMMELPDQDANNIWFITQNFGLAEIHPANQLLLKSTVGTTFAFPSGPPIDSSFGYARLEPFLAPDLVMDLDVTFQVDTGSEASQDVSIEIHDTVRMVRLATLHYTELGPLRSLVSFIKRSFTGLLPPDTQAFEFQGSSWNAEILDRTTRLSLSSGETWDLESQLPNLTPGTGRVLEIRFTNASRLTTSDPAGFTGLVVSVETGTLQGVGISLRLPTIITPARVLLVSSATGNVELEVDFPWNDGLEHFLRALIDVNTATVSLICDDVVQGTVPLGVFAPTTSDNTLALEKTSALLTGVFDLLDFSAVELPWPGVLRTLGVYLEGDVDDINSWEIPRTDSTTAPNSDALQAVVFPMDFTSPIQVRIRRDPAWGVCILRPDLPPPPYFDGQWATEITQPSAGWINVQWANLPNTEFEYGIVRWGSLRPDSISQSRFRELRYRIYEFASSDYVMPHHMVLNQYNLIHSGELYYDKTVETVTVLSQDAFTVLLLDGDIHAEQVFQIQFQAPWGQQIIVYPSESQPSYDPETQLPPPVFLFDKESQTITLFGTSFGLLGPVAAPNPGEEINDTLQPGTGPQLANLDAFEPNAPVPKNHIPVTVTFRPGTPVSTTYLQTQPFLQGATILAEGSVPVPKSQTGTYTVVSSIHGTVNDPSDPNNPSPDFILNGPWPTITVEDVPDALYEELTFVEVTNGGWTHLLSPACDSTFAGHGLLGMDLSGDQFLEYQDVLPIDDGQPLDGYGQPLAPAPFLENSGGGYEDGNLNNALLFGTINLWPNNQQIPGQGVQAGVFGFLYDIGTGVTTPVYFT
jgi:hypothetical protein